MISLNLADIGETFKIFKINGKDEQIKYLQSLGFIINNEISIINKNGNNLIVNVKDTRIAIGKQIANKIQGEIVVKEKVFVKRKKII